MQRNGGILQIQRRQDALLNQHLPIQNRHSIVACLLSLREIEGNLRNDCIGNFLGNICSGALFAVDVLHIFLPEFKPCRRPVVWIVRLRRCRQNGGVLRTVINNCQKAILTCSMHHSIDGHQCLRLGAGRVVSGACQGFNPIILAVDPCGIGGAVICRLTVTNQCSAAVWNKNIAVNGIRIGTPKEGQEGHGFQSKAVAVDVFRKGAFNQLCGNPASFPGYLYLKGDSLLFKCCRAKQSIVQNLKLRCAVLSNADPAFHAFAAKALNGDKPVSVAAPGGVYAFGLSNREGSPQIARVFIQDPQRRFFPIQKQLQLLRFPNLLKSLGGKPAFHRFRREGVYLPVGVCFQQTIAQRAHDLPLRLRILCCCKNADRNECSNQQECADFDNPFMRTHGNAPPQRLRKGRTAVPSKE